MSERRSLTSSPLRSIASIVVVWIIVGVPVAAVIAAFRVFVWVIFSLPDMAATAAALGPVHAFWLYLTGPSSETKSTDLPWFASVSGGILGLLGFLPVFSRINGVVADRALVAACILAALGGGIAAGFASAKFVSLPRSRLSRAVAVGCLLVLPLAALDFHFFWPPTVDRLPVARLSSQAVTQIPAGDARGSAWAGCYQYRGQTSRGSGMLGGEGGILEVRQTDGRLQVLDGSANPLLGGVDRDGRFRFGAERTTAPDTLRVLWEGRFSDGPLNFTRRMTVLRAARILNTTRLNGTAQRVSCNQ